MITEEKKQWLSVRRSTLTDYYDLPADKVAEADQLFLKMEEVADACSDQGEFEQKMLNSPLQQEFVSFVTACAPYVKKAAGGEGPSTAGDLKSRAASVVGSEAKIGAKRLLNEYVPIEGYDWSEPWWYAIPIIGSLFRRIAFARNEVDQVERLMGRKKDDEEQA